MSSIFLNGKLLGIIVLLAIALVIIVAVLNVHTRRTRVKALTQMESSCLTSQDNARILVLMYVHSSRCAAAARAVASYWSHAACPRRVTLAVYHAANHQTAAEFQAAVSQACLDGKYGFDFTPGNLRITHVPENQDMGRLAAFGMLGRQYASEHAFFWMATDGAIAAPRWDARFIETWRALPDEKSLLIQNIHPETQDILYGTWKADKYGMPTVQLRGLPRLHEDFVGTIEVLPIGANEPTAGAVNLRWGWIGGHAELLETTAAFGLHMLGGSPRYEATWLSAQLHQEGHRFFLCLEPLTITIPSTTTSATLRAKSATSATQLPGLSVARRQGIHDALQRVTSLFTSGAPPIRTELDDSQLLYAKRMAAKQPQRSRQKRSALMTEAAITRALILGLHRAGFSHMDKDLAARHPLLSSPVAAFAAVEEWHAFAGLVVRRAPRVEVGKPLATITVTGRGRMGLLPTQNEREHMRDVLSKFPNMQAYIQEKMQYNLMQMGV
ncbi:unnamed protein product [Symbiodinium sp. KB8]|nr:unnamed protein product [Symbiodinium sp. KB8]